MASQNLVLTSGSGIIIIEDTYASTVTMSADIATSTEINTGTSGSKVISPDSLAGSLTGTKFICKYKVGIITPTGTGYMYIPVPEWAWNTTTPWEIVDVEATVDNAGITGNTTIQLTNGITDILSTPITIETAEFTSKDSATSAVIDESYKSLSEVKRIRVDIDAIFTATPAQHLTIIIGIRRP